MLSLYQAGLFYAAPAIATSRDKAVFGGGDGGSVLNVLDTFSIAAGGTAIDHDDLSLARRGLAAVSDGDKAVFGGGDDEGPTSESATTLLDTFSILSGGTATAHGNLFVARRLLAAVSNGDKAVFGGGQFVSLSTVLDTFSITSGGTASDHGHLSVARRGLAAVSDGDKAVFGGGDHTGSGSVGNTKVLDTFSIAAGGTAVNHGELAVARRLLAAVSNSDKAVFGGGEYQTTELDTFSIAAGGTASEHGFLSLGRRGLAAVSDGDKAVFGGGGLGGNTYDDTLDTFSIAAGGTATNHGDLSLARRHLAAVN